MDAKRARLRTAGLERGQGREEGRLNSLSPDVEREVAELKARGVVFEDYGMPVAESPSAMVTLGGPTSASFEDTA
jgi:hypothetical protein